MAQQDQPSTKSSEVAQTEYEFDVFISYSSKDKAWVRGELLTRIEQAGLKAFIDFRDFEPGASSIEECQRGVLTSRRTLVVLTPEYAKSGWTKSENIMAATLDAANQARRIIPILKAPCDKPLYIAALTHIDFTDGADFDLAWCQLLTALGAPPTPEPPKQPRRGDWFLPYPYLMPPNFTGRLAERKMLTDWLESDTDHPLLSLRALGGFGKSALGWHWLTHDVKPAAWPRVVWWSFYEGDSSFDHFLGDTLHYLGVEQAVCQAMSAHKRVERLLQLLQEPGTLLVLDGFERVLRAFGGLDAAYKGDDPLKSEVNDSDCVSPLAERFLRGVATLPAIRAKVLLTTRLCPRVLQAKAGGFLQGCREEELKQMQPDDAIEFFHAQGIRGARTEIEQACAPYGYHPLSLSLLTGVIVHDFQQPGDIAAARRIDVSGDLVQRQNHVLKVAYDSLTPARQALLGRIACFRSPMKYDALKALAEAVSIADTQKQHGAEQPSPTPSLSADVGSTLDADLRDLIARGLLHHDIKDARFDLHPIVRRYAYDRLAAPDRTAAHTHLRDYFAAVPKPENVTTLEDLAPDIELYHHTVRAGQYDEAYTLFRDRINRAAYYQLGAYQLRIDLLTSLFPDGEDRPPRLSDEDDQAWTLNGLANSYSLSGQPRIAAPLFERQIVIREKQGDRLNLAIGLGNLANRRRDLGALRTAETNLRRSIALSREIHDEFQEAIDHNELGRLLACRGAYAESERGLTTALEMFERQKRVQMQGVTWAYRAQRQLLLHSTPLSADPKSQVANPNPAFTAARRALELADEDARTDYPVERDYVRAHWLLGAAHRVAGEHDQAERHLHEALQRCRRINAVDAEADILIDLTRLRAATGASDEAQRLAEEAQLITDRAGYVLQGADAHLELAKLARTRGDTPAALDHAQEALRLATCDGPPDYTYKAAYDEATALITQLSATTNTP